MNHAAPYINGGRDIPQGNLENNNPPRPPIIVSSCKGGDQRRGRLLQYSDAAMMES